MHTLSILAVCHGADHEVKSRTDMKRKYGNAGFHSQCIKMQGPKVGEEKRNKW